MSGTTTTTTPEAREAAPVPPLARGPVAGAMVALAVVLTLTSGGYGYHRDELYFRMLRPAWGYVDQPPLAPLLVRGAAALVDEVWALRVPATAAAVASVLVVTLITRELGGGRGAQALCAWAFAFATTPMVMGHVFVTASIDLLAWPLVTLLVVRGLLRARPGWWVGAGVVAGLATFNKLLIAALLVSLAAGLLAVGPRRVLRTPGPWAAAAVTLVLSLPALLHQVASGWPQLTMGRALAENNAAEVRVAMWPFLLLWLGPPLVPVWLAGWWALARRPGWRPVRSLAVAFPVVLALTFVAGAQTWYPFGLLAVLFAAGCVPVAEFASRHPGWRRALVAGVAVNAAVSAVIALPVLPVTVVGGTAVPATNTAMADSVGWPAHVRQVAGVWNGLPADDRADGLVLTSNYGQAGAIDRFGPALGLPRPYSGQNQLWFERRPTDQRVAVFVGGRVRRAERWFGSCTVVARLDNGVGVDNEEQGQPVAVCRDPLLPWSQLWPRLQHYD